MITSPRRARMSFLDRWLAAWILLAMVAGLLIGRLVPAVEPFLSAMEIGDISVPIALGLLVMMYPPLAKVRYDKAVEITSDRRDRKSTRLNSSHVAISYAVLCLKK